MPPKPSCECGTCRLCKRRPQKRARYLETADRVREQARASRLRRLEAARAYDRARKRAVEEQKRVARMASRKLRRLGPLPCEVCGTTLEIQAHHDDYSKPLEIRWLCREHHMELHRPVAA